MRAIVMYESIYGNSRSVAEAVAEGLGGAPVHSVNDGVQDIGPADITVVGGPTHMHGLASARSRRMAVEAVEEDGATAVEPGAGDGPGLRSWLRRLASGDGRYAATFDTRLDRSPALTGVASRGIARRLRRRGFEVLDSASFLVQEAEGPLEPGELDRARDWGAQLAETVKVRDEALRSAVR